MAEGRDLAALAAAMQKRIKVAETAAALTATGQQMQARIVHREITKK